MKVVETELPGVLIIELKIHGDQRGFFVETFHAARYAEAGIPGHFVQDNHSRSRKGVLRGLHFQLKHPQGKLVRVSRGSVFDVAVDIRFGSPHFGQWFGTLLSEENQRQLYIPPGFANGFCVVSDDADFQYKCSDYYDPKDENGVVWDDPDIGISWPMDKVLLSEKDRKNPRLSELPQNALPIYGD